MLVIRMLETGKLAQVVREFGNCNLAILGISESRRTGTGKRQPHHTLLMENRQSARRRSRHNIPKQTGKKTLNEWKPMGARLVTVRFN